MAKFRESCVRGRQTGTRARESDRYRTLGPIPRDQVRALVEDDGRFVNLYLQDLRATSHWADARDRATASQLQGPLNALAKAHRSHSAIKKARTHLKAMFELAVDDKILDVSPALRITMPKRIRRVDDRYADRTALVRALFNAAGHRDRILLRPLSPAVCARKNVRPSCQRYRAWAVTRGRSLEQADGFCVCWGAENNKTPTDMCRCRPSLRQRYGPGPRRGDPAGRTAIPGEPGRQSSAAE